MYKPRDGPRDFTLALSTHSKFRIGGSSVVIGMEMAILDVPTSRFKTCKSL